MRFDWISGHEHAPMWWNSFVHCFWRVYERLPQRYAIPGKSRVRYDFCYLADELYHLQDGFEKRSNGTGLVAAYQWAYQGPDDHRYPRAGMYARNMMFPGGFIVKPDDGGALLCVPIDSAQLISGYGYAVPRSYALSKENQRIGDLPQSLVAYPQDMVRLPDDPADIERLVGRVSFTARGEPRYEVFNTPEEYKALQEVERKKYRGVLTSIMTEEGIHPGTHAWVHSSDITVVRRGNVYHLMNGKPEDLRFDSLEKEVRFWSHWAGEWLADKPSHSKSRYDKYEAMRRIEDGEFDLAIEMGNGEHTPIRIFDRYEKFRERARKVGLEYLKDRPARH